MFRKLLSVASVLVLACSAMLSGCAGARPQVKLKLWASVQCEELYEDRVERFKQLHAKEANIDISLRFIEEGETAENISAYPDNAGDVFSFPADQLRRMVRMDALLPVSEQYVQSTCEACGGVDSAAIDSATLDGTLYARPETSGNGYFLFYNAAEIDEADTHTLDDLLDACERSGKKFAMDWTSGWYLYSFFGGAGMGIHLNPDGVSNYCDWNRTDGPVTGVQVAEALLAIAAHPAFESLGNLDFKPAVADGSIAAGVNGPWNVDSVRQAWGDDMRICKLPTYTLPATGEQLQMWSFAGFKLVGVNKHTQEPEWAERLAEYLVSPECEIEKFEVVGECPANVTAAAAPEILESPAVAALAAQSPYAVKQEIAEPFWNAATVFGTLMTAGNPDGRDLQMILDNLVQSACVPVENP